MIRALVLALAAMAAFPVAAEEINLRSERVRVADLDLSSAEGVAALDRRLSRAALRACEKSGLTTVWDNRMAYDCQARTLARVADQRDSVIAAARAGSQMASQGATGAPTSASN